MCMHLEKCKNNNNNKVLDKNMKNNNISKRMYEKKNPFYLFIPGEKFCKYSKK